VANGERSACPVCAEIRNPAFGIQEDSDTDDLGFTYESSIDIKHEDNCDSDAEYRLLLDRRNTGQRSERNRQKSGSYGSCSQSDNYSEPENIADSAIYPKRFLKTVLRATAISTAFIVALLIHAGFIAMGIKTYYIVKEPNSIWHRQYFMIYRIIYWSYMLISVAVGLCCGSRLARGTPQFPIRRLQRFEYFVLFAVIGQMTSCFVALIANLHIPKATSTTVVFLVDEILNGLQGVTRSAFYMYIARLKFPPHLKSNGRSSATRIVYKAVLLNFVLCNLAMWSEISFVETRNHSKFFQHKYYDIWPIMYNGSCGSSL